MNYKKTVYKCDYCSRIGHLEGFCIKKKKDFSDINLSLGSINLNKENDTENSPLSVLNCDSSFNISKNIKKEEHDEEYFLLKKLLDEEWLMFEKQALDKLLEKSELPDSKYKFPEKKCKFCIDYNKRNGTELDDNHWTKHPVYHNLCEFDNSFILCPLLRNHTCYRCKRKGHTPNYCNLKKLIESGCLISPKDKEKYKNTDQENLIIDFTSSSDEEE